jgi:hypothetical protein
MTVAGTRGISSSTSFSSIPELAEPGHSSSSVAVLVFLPRVSARNLVGQTSGRPVPGTSGSGARTWSDANQPCQRHSSNSMLSY